jgi:3-phenylpropionate/cinnamic acid dioxygenase small subunit
MRHPDHIDGHRIVARNRDSKDLKEEVQELYWRYTELIDGGNLTEWLDLFCQECRYSVVSRENWEAGLPLSTMLCDSRGMLADRVHAIEHTSMFEPRKVRHLTGPVRVLSSEGTPLQSSATFVVFRTIGQAATELFATGQYFDELVSEGGAVKFAQRTAVYDSPMIANSLVYPL